MEDFFSLNTSEKRCLLRIQQRHCCGCKSATDLHISSSRVKEWRDLTQRDSEKKKKLIRLLRPLLFLLIPAAPGVSQGK